ncbi:hypothetical protein [Lentilactobacillus farraginis]|uniref:Uncharacterized protein n=1 Tax=Lentilactobacillus farraginis DSM 18382 = JCM 14108 TaxID=1423743 RepID=A0A0R1W304_9LACO|nr:hypothetical protein [Lentilactobacillus farraginis]KRM12240.1 hypothetical protein FD41_GL000598 [Lentilactobacillus farraginis DSM 18382 = JCM 14108]
MHRLKSAMIMLMAVISFSFFFSINSLAESGYNKVPKVLIGKYWKINKSKNGSSAKYFWGSKREYVFKRVGKKKLVSKIHYSIKYHTGYILIGSDPRSANKYIWWYLRPFDHFKKIQVGFTTISKKKTPKGLPSQYAKSIAYRINKDGAPIHS